MTGVTTITITVTGGQSTLTKGHITATHGQFSGIRQVAPVCSVHPPPT